MALKKVLRKSGKSGAVKSNAETPSAHATLSSFEATKEELRSSIEELRALNDELQRRNNELNVLTQDLSNLLVGFDLPLLLLDAELRIRRFTPQAGVLLNLKPGDEGRPFTDIASPLAVVGWESLCSEVKRDGRLIEREVSDRTGHRYLLRLRPYKTRGDEIDGLLVILFDIDATKRLLEEARKSRDLAIEAERLSDSILNSLTANVAVLSSEGIILATNDAWNQFAKANGNPALTSVGQGANYLQVCGVAASRGVRDAQLALDGIQSVLEGRNSAFELEYSCHSSTEQRWFVMNVSRLKGTKGGAVITHLNNTDRRLAEMAAQKSEYTTRSLLASTPQSVIAVGIDRKIVFVNGNVEKMFGYSQHELIGQTLERLVPEGARDRHVEHHRGYFANMQTRPMGIGLDLEGRRRDGTTFPVDIGLSAIETAEGKIAIAFVSDITERKLLELAARTYAQEVHALAASLMTAQEEERRRVSRELHDQICQQLASLAIDIGGLAADLPLPRHAQSRLKALQDRVVKASEETRHIAYELHPSVLDDLGLVASLQDLGKQFASRTKIALKFTHDTLPPSVPREIASCLYRVAQESLQNIVKHANAKRVVIALTVRKGAITLRIVDDGAGFDLSAVKGRGGLGLIGMEERARLVKGKLAVVAQSGGGTRIALEIPLP